MADIWSRKKRSDVMSKIRMCGNSVCPQVAAAMVRANYSVQEAMPAPERAAESAP